MKKYSFAILLITGICFFTFSCGNPPAENTADTTKTAAADTVKPVTYIVSDSVTYTSNGNASVGYISYDSNHQGKLPVVVIIPEWWGLGEYVKGRARELAALGYFAICADLFGNGKTASNPQEAMAFTKPYYMNPALARPVIEAAIAKAGSFPQADTTRTAAIGYCFGGFIVLNAVKQGTPLKAAVSFHGGLGGLQPKKGVIKADILVCQGGADSFVQEPEQAAFKKSMDSVGAHYSFVTYPGAMHAFSNPGATALGEKFKLPIAYNAAADTASFKAMELLFSSTLK